MLILASLSNARRQLLSQITKNFIAVTGAHDETIEGNDPIEYARNCALNKISAVINKNQRYRRYRIISADTVFFTDDTILGKPANNEQARSYLRMLSASWSSAYTVTALVEPEQVEARWLCDRADMLLRKLRQEEISRWCANAKITHYAGAFAIQHQCAEWISRLKGQRSTVIGLNLDSARTLLGHSTPVDRQRSMPPCESGRAHLKLSWA